MNQYLLSNMSLQFAISDVSAEFMMDVAKVIASSPHPLTKEDLTRSFKKSKSYISHAISQCLQIGLIELQNGQYVGSARHRDLIKRSERSQLYLPLREALQRYPPFLLYIDFFSKGYSTKDSATMTRGIFRIQSTEDLVEKAFRTWGLYAQLFCFDPSGGLSIPEAERGLASEYVENLIRALRAELQASIFIIETMSPQAFVYLTEKKIGIEDLTDALINYEKNSKSSANKACQTFEHFLYKLGEDVGANVSTCNGIIEYVDAIRKQNEILKNQLHLCHGIGGLRNMAHHDPDKESGGPWSFTPQGAIISTLIVPTMIRSLYLCWKEKKQEF
jgi:predicted transcriptional regulator